MKLNRIINIQQLIKFKQENKIKICQKLECAYYFRFFSQASPCYETKFKTTLTSMFKKMFSRNNITISIPRTLD